MSSTVSTQPRTEKVRSTVSIPVLGKVVIALIIGLMLGIIYRHYSLSYGPNSDFANQLLEGYSFAHGNYLLSHWYLTTVSWYTTDVILFAIGVWIRGFHPVLLHEVPIFVYLVLLAVTMYLASGQRLRTIERGWRGMFMVFALLGLPMEMMGLNLLMGSFRIGTVLLALIAFACIDRCGEESEKVSPLRAALFGLILAVCLVSDNFPTYTAIVPVILVSLYRGWRYPELRRTEVMLAITAAIATIAAKLTIREIGAMGGFIMPESYAGSIQIIPMENLWRNIRWTVEGLQTLYHANFWDQPVGIALAMKFGRLVLPGIILYSMIVLLKPFFTKKQEAEPASATRFPILSVSLPLHDRVSLYLAVGMAINLFAYTFSKLSAGVATTRYLVPFAIYGAVIAGRLLTRNVAPEWEKSRRKLFLAGVLGVVLTVPTFLMLAIRPHVDPPARRLAEALKAQNLTDGYAGYWSGTDVVVQSRDTVHVRAVMIGPDGLQPFLFGSDERWYKEGVPSNFFVIDPLDPDITVKMVVNQFGKPNRTFQVEGCTVLVYDHDIAPLLKHRAVVR